MKKIIFLFISIIILVGCANQNLITEDIVMNNDKTYEEVEIPFEMEVLNIHLIFTSLINTIVMLGS